MRITRPRSPAAAGRGGVVAVFGATTMAEYGASGEARAWATEIHTNSSPRDCATAVGAHRAGGRSVSRKERCGGPLCPTGHRNLSSQERPALEAGAWRFQASLLGRRIALLRYCGAADRPLVAVVRPTSLPGAARPRRAPCAPATRAVSPAGRGASSSL